MQNSTPLRSPSPRRLTSPCGLRLVSLTLSMTFFCAAAVHSQERKFADETVLTESERIQHTLSRFAFGPTPTLIKKVRAMGLDKWFEAQLKSEVQESQTLTRHLADYISLDLNIEDTVRMFRVSAGRNASAEDRREARRLQRVPRQEQKDAILLRAILSNHQVREATSDFFRNHLNISVNKSRVQLLVANYERRVIREGVLGNFGDMLRTSATHPAMLIYLDNALSRRPPSKAELRNIGRKTKRKTGSKSRAEESIEIAKQRGLNENYARELLELHTLGVDNYYKQKDVIEVAKALTGWTVGRGGRSPGFRFRSDMHSKGPKYILGRTIQENSDDPMQEGLKVIDVLLKHPGTAKFIAWKLCRHFVDDAPPKDMVKRVAAVFRSKKGDLPSVYRAIYKDREFFRPVYFQSKFKRPFEFIVSALRVTDAKLTSTAQLHRTLNELSEPIYECEDPTGYYDQAEAWRDPGVMAVRWRFAMNLALGKIKGIRIPESFYANLHPTIARAWKDQLAVRILPAGLSEHTRKVLDEMVKAYIEKHKKVRRRDLAPRIVGLLIGSPEFQRQ